MCGKSHITLGEHLICRYLPELPRCCRAAFLLGCIQPDKNPATYLKGSFRCQWLRGHNYRNARRFMTRISRRLEAKNQLNILDYYTLGKLIHYTADAFTAAHNDFFPENLSCHRQYELQLQAYFLSYLRNAPHPQPQIRSSVMAGICRFHREYSSASFDVSRDSRFVWQACCCVLVVVLSSKLHV